MRQSSMTQNQFKTCLKNFLEQDIVQNFTNVNHKDKFDQNIQKWKYDAKFHMIMCSNILFVTFNTLQMLYLLIFQSLGPIWLIRTIINIERLICIYLVIRFKKNPLVSNFLLAKDQILVIIVTKILTTLNVLNPVGVFYACVIYLILIQLISQQILLSWLIQICFIIVQWQFILDQNIIIGYIPIIFNFMFYLTYMNKISYDLFKELAIKINQSAKLDSLNQISHENKSQINVINTFANMIMDKSEDANSKIEDFREIAESIINCNIYNQYALEKYLDFNKLQNKEFTLINKDFDLEECINKITHIFVNIAQHSNNQIQIDQSLQSKIMNGDINRVSLIIFIILQNCLNFTQDGNIDIYFTNIENYIYFEIKDNGKGMSQDTIDQILNQEIFFHQEQKDNTKKRTEMGIGLYLSIQILDRINQSRFFQINSLLNRGTRVAFLLQQRYQTQISKDELQKQFQKKFEDNLLNQNQQQQIIPKNEIGQNDIKIEVDQEKDQSYQNVQPQDNQKIIFKEQKEQLQEVNQREQNSNIQQQLNDENQSQDQKSLDILNFNLQKENEDNCSQNLKKSSNQEIELKFQSQQMIQNIDREKSSDIIGQKFAPIRQKQNFTQHHIQIKPKICIINPKKKKQIKIPQSKNYQLNIMVVDDTWNNQLAIQFILKKLEIKHVDINLTFQDDGITGFQEFKRRNIFKDKQNLHIIIMDFYMRHMNGDEATMKITDLYKRGFQKAFIIGHSTDNDNSMIDTFKKAGAQHFEPKPTNPKNMKIIIQKYVDENFQIHKENNFKDDNDNENQK